MKAKFNELYGKKLFTTRHHPIDKAVLFFVESRIGNFT